MNDIFASIGVLFVLGLAMVITKLLSKHLSAEISRKIIHITMGLTAISFPFVFQNRISVVILGGIAIGALSLLRSIKTLRNGIGAALLGVKRKSYGEIYFAVSIVIVFVMHQSTFEYLVPILVLTFADSVAALVGTSYGRYNMAHGQEDTKSSEGSVMFFIVAFICTLVPLQLMTEIGRAEVLVISFLIGLLAAMIEAVSTNGNDNILLPLLTYSFLRYNCDKPLELLFTNFGVMLFFLVIILFVYKIANISKLSVAYSLLVGYIIMVQGGATWVVPPLALILMYGILPKMKTQEKQMILSYKVIECNTIAGVICLWLAVFFPQYREILYIAYSFSFACHLTINTYSRFINFENSKQSVAVICGLAKGIVFIALPTLLLTKMNCWIFVLYLVFLAVSIPPSISLNKKYDYKSVNSITTRANKMLVGTLTAIFAAAGGLLICYI